MARPIAETPTLYGKDAERFAENMKRLRPFLRKSVKPIVLLLKKNKVRRREMG